MNLPLKNLASLTLQISEFANTELPGWLAPDSFDVHRSESKLQCVDDLATASSKIYVSTRCKLCYSFGKLVGFNQIIWFTDEFLAYKLHEIYSNLMSVVKQHSAALVELHEAQHKLEHSVYLKACLKALQLK